MVNVEKQQKAKELRDKLVFLTQEIKRLQKERAKIKIQYVGCCRRMNKKSKVKSYGGKGAQEMYGKKKMDLSDDELKEYNRIKKKESRDRIKNGIKKNNTQKRKTKKQKVAETFDSDFEF